MSEYAIKDEEELRRLYYIEKMTKGDLMEHYGVSRQAVYNAFKRFDLVKANHDSDRKPPNIAIVTENLPDHRSTWELSDRGRQAISKAYKRAKTKHGLYADIPILCFMKDCPYSDTCKSYENEECAEGEKCPEEIGLIMYLTKLFVDEFDIKKEDATDMSLLRDLIDTHIMIARADKLISKDGSIIDEVAVGVTEDGKTITRPEVTKAADFKDRLMKRKKNILNELNATRKDKAKTEEEDKKDFSSMLSDVLSGIQGDGNKKEEKIIEISEDDIEEEKQ